MQVIAENLTAEEEQEEQREPDPPTHPPIAKSNSLVKLILERKNTLL